MDYRSPIPRGAATNLVDSQVDSGWTAKCTLKLQRIYLRKRSRKASIPCVCRHTYNLSMRFNYVNSMMARMNRAVGDAAEMTKVL
ncbi:MAG: hypothetical protein IKG22_08445, partial [Atopobiaceae bacterium]|nr:hypothetical protein [Atopobiaceae bacterium]